MDMRVDHVSIAVNDIDTALRFFRNCLPIEMRMHKRQGYDDDFNWCDFYIGQFKLELIEARHPASFVRRFIDKRGEGLHHLSLEVTQLEPLIERLAADGVRIVDRFDGGDGDVTAFISPRSAHGVLVQFWNVDNIVAPERPHTVPFRLRTGETVLVHVNHVSMAVRSIDRTLDFYRRYFPIRAEHPKHPGYDGSFVLTTFTLNGYRIELIEPALGHEAGFVARFLDKRGEGFHHLSIDVNDLDPLLTQLEADGVRIVDRADIGGGWKTAFISPRSAHGVLIQFWQDPSLGR
ncbi:MAG TPA: VOC family protein [Candidatus Margulisiibacteriota bacterium]|nr:VOC family protein [Candidatus Margulisiibacteriota bacterium]